MAWLCKTLVGGTSKAVMLVAVILNLFSISHCRRLSLKESLTAYTEDPREQDSSGSSTTTSTSENPKYLPEFSTSTPSSLPGGAVFTNSISGHSPNSPGGNVGEGKFSLLEITKNMLFPSLQKESSNNVITGMSSSTLNPSMSHNNEANSADNNNDSYYKDSSIASGRGKVAYQYDARTKESPHQAWQNFLTTVKNEVEGIKGKWDNKNRENSNISKPLQKVHNIMKEGTGADLRDDENEQAASLRSKKEVGSNSGLRDLLWNTATALWSKNRVHFLPTFLHTKTGGKLSLIRESIFKPVTILSQFTHGIHEINNEKWNNLARLTTAGSGWHSHPPRQVVVIKVQPENSKLWTLARYIFRLTKHTAITKWRLKRALLDLQLRALRKLLRILSSKTVHQKLATVKILTSAIINGKLSLLRILTGRNRHNATHPYPGKDNAAHVDITYSSLNQHDHNQKPNSDWSNYHHEYKPPSMQFLPFRPMSPAGTPPSKINYYHYETPILGESSRNTAVVPPPPNSEPLIDSPSYAGLLETMGIHPTSFDYDGASKNNYTTTTPAPSSLPPSQPAAPAPTVVYYSSSSNSNPPTATFATTSTSTTASNPYPSYESLLREKPSASYAFHLSSNDGSSNHLDSSPSSSLRSYLSSFQPLEGSYTPPYLSKTEEDSGGGSVISSSSSSDSISTTPKPSSFRMKLLQSMEVMEGVLASLAS